jgi:hypothetical protein
MMNIALATSPENIFTGNEIAVSSERQHFVIEIPAKEQIVRVRSSPYKSYRPRRALQKSYRSRILTVESSSTKKYDDVLTELTRLSAYPAGWNGYPSSAADGSSFDLAKRFVELLRASSRVFQVSASIHAAGTAMVDIQGTNFLASIEFLPNGEIAANIDDHDGAQDFDLESFDGTKIPNDLARFFL